MIPALSKWLTVTSNAARARILCLVPETPCRPIARTSPSEVMTSATMRQVANVDFETSTDQSVACSSLMIAWRAASIPRKSIDFDDVVGVGAASIDGFDFAHTDEVGTNGRKVVLSCLVIKLHVCPLNAWDTLETHVTNLLFKLQQAWCRMAGSLPVQPRSSGE